MSGTSDAGSKLRAGRPSLARGLLPLLAVLLVVGIVANWRDLTAIASGQRSLHAVLYGGEKKPIGRAFSFPPPAGPADAKIEVHVIAVEGYCCQRPLVALWLGISDLEPKRIRVEFVPSSDMASTVPKGSPRPLEVGCEAGVVINGVHKFALGAGANARTVYLSGPVPDPNLIAGRAVGLLGHGWSYGDLATILNRLIQQKYKQPGQLTGAAIEQAAKAADSRVPPPRG